MNTVKRWFYGVFVFLNSYVFVCFWKFCAHSVHTQLIFLSSKKQKSSINKVNFGKIKYPNFYSWGKHLVVNSLKPLKWIGLLGAKRLLRSNYIIQKASPKYWWGEVRVIEPNDSTCSIYIYISVKSFFIKISTINIRKIKMAHSLVRILRWVGMI